MPQRFKWHTVSKILFWIVLLGPILLLATCMGVYSGLIPIPVTTARTREIYVKATHRAMASSIESYFSDYSEFPHNRPFWGAIGDWNESMDKGDAKPFHKFSQERTGWEIDPFNQHGPDGQRKRGIRYTADRGALVRIRGFDHHFWLGKESGWAVISRGPDEDLDLTQEILDDIVTLDKEQKYSTLRPLLYDSTNGTFSGGDIFRSNDGIDTPP